MANLVTRKTLIGELVNNYPETADVLYGVGMHCLGCPASQADSVEDACGIHEINPDFVVTALNEKIAAVRE